MKRSWTLAETAGICGIRFLNGVALCGRLLPEGLKKEAEACGKAIAKEIPWDTWRERIDKHLGVPTDVLLALGFRSWNDGDPQLWLIPFWLMPYIPDGFPVVAIDGEHLAWDKNRIDDDVRFGCLAYGIEVPKPAKEGAQCVDGLRGDPDCRGCEEHCEDVRKRNCFYWNPDIGKCALDGKPSCRISCGDFRIAKEEKPAEGGTECSSR